VVVAAASALILARCAHSGRPCKRSSPLHTDGTPLLGEQLGPATVIGVCDLVRCGQPRVERQPPRTGQVRHAQQTPSRFASDRVCGRRAARTAAGASTREAESHASSWVSRGSFMN